MWDFVFSCHYHFLLSSGKVTSFYSIDGCQTLGATCCHCLHFRIVHWRWRQESLPKHCYPLTEAYSITSQKIITLFISSLKNGRSRDSSVSIVTWLWTVRSGVWMPAEEREFSLLRNVQIDRGTYSSSYSMSTGVIWQEVNQPERDVNHSRPSSAEVSNKWRYTSAPPICLQAVDREKFTFFRKLQRP